MEPAILQQLIWIKWLLIAIACIFAAIGIAFLWLMRSFAKIPEQVKAEASFSDRARSLLDQGKPEEAALLAETRIAKYPADAHALWVHGQANFRTGELRGALRSLKKAQELQPDWEVTYTVPLMRLIEQRIADGDVKTDLKVVAFNPAGLRCTFLTLTGALPNRVGAGSHSCQMLTSREVSDNSPKFISGVEVCH